MLEKIKYDDRGLVVSVIQSQQSGRVLMVAWMNQEALSQTISTGETVFFSRSRNKLWHKGETSGNIQKVIKIELDCDFDSLLITVDEAGAACHNGTQSCFDTATILGAANNEA